MIEPHYTTAQLSILSAMLTERWGSVRINALSPKRKWVEYTTKEIRRDAALAETLEAALVAGTAIFVGGGPL